MNNKKSYSLKEVEEMVIAVDNYRKASKNYYSFLSIANSITGFLFADFKKLLEVAENDLNESKKNCKEKLPKSLLDKLIKD